MFKASEITSKEYKAIPLKAEYHQFLGRFSQDGSILMSGSPGGGKSTLALQLLADMIRHGNALYIPAEEGADSFTTQEKIKRLSIPEEIYLAEWEGFEKLKDDIRDHSIRYVCLDSITYIDKNLSEFDDFRLWCKGRDVVLIVIAHSTKSGSYKGSSDLEHMVDTSIWVYPDSDDRKFAKTKKNRFGPCPKEIEIFMEAEERENPVLGAPSKVSITNEGIDLFYGLEYVEIPDEQARENRGVSPDEIYQMITDRIISTLKKSGKLPWHKPWKGSGIGKGLGARNYISKKLYRGINWVMLNTEYKDGSLRLRSFTNPYFMTFNQVEKLGGKVKKGSTGNEVVYFTKLYNYKQYDPDLEYGTYSPQKMAAWLRKNAKNVLGKDRVITRSDGIQATTKNPSTIEDLISDILSRYVPILKYYKVFHASDIDGIEWKDLPETNEEKTEFQRIETAEAIWDNYPKAPKVVHKEQQAYYTPLYDRINMPIKESFDNEQYYYSTLFHEGVHSTGHPKRLARDMSGRFGNEEYAFEELIAELGATFLCAESGILFQTIDNSQAYLQGWSKRLIKNLEDDNRFFFRASSRAQAATDLILDRDKDGAPYIPVIGTSEDLKRDQNQVNGYKAAGMRKNHADYLLMPSSELQELLQIDRTPLSADLTNLCKKHPEVFKSEKQVQRFIEEVNKQPELILPATNKGYVLIIHFSRNHKAMVLEMAVKQNKRRIRTAYEMKTDQVVVKIEKLTKQSDSHFPKVLGEHYQGAGMPSDIRSALSALLKDKNSASDRQNPDPLVFIGFCEQLHILQNENIPWMAGKFPMFTNTAGTKLYILPQRRVKAVRNKVEDEKATEMFENWSHYPASFKDFEIDLPDGKGKTVGTAHKIFYASDKVMQPGDKKGKVNRYKHDFNPNKRPAKVIDDVLIIENIKITGRGIMN